MKKIPLLLCFFIMLSNLVFAEEKKHTRFTVDYFMQPVIMPEIEFLDFNGNPHLLEEFENSAILIYMWATWCNICVNEMLELDLLQKSFRKKPLKIIALSEDFKGVDVVKSFYTNKKIKYLDIYTDTKNNLFNALGAHSLPTAFVINANGSAVAKIQGSIDWQDEEINELLNKYVGEASVNYNDIPKHIANKDVEDEKTTNK